VAPKKYDIILVGSGFASIFFLHKVLNKRRDIKVLIVERGSRNSWAWQVENKTNAPERDRYDHHIEQTGMRGKYWPHTIGLGGSSNCWWANPTRIHPDDFRLRSKFGASVDWPISYDDLETYYTEAEEIISVSGDNDSGSIFPRSKPFPQPRHRFSRVARTFKNRYPDLFFAMPQARARVATAIRNPCCSNHICGTCPVNAKFTIVEDLAWIFDDPRVELQLETKVEQIVVAGGVATGVEGRSSTGDFRAAADFVALGANGIYNPFILLKSGITHGPVGKGLHEQIGVYVDADLDGLEDGDGSSFITGAGYNFATGEFRRHAAGGFYELINILRYRIHPTKFRCRLSMVILLDDMRQHRNFVSISTSNPEKPRAHFEDWSPYAYAGLAHVRQHIGALLAHLPIEELRIKYGTPGGHAHLQGTTVMGRNPETSVVDPALLHHRIRNLAILGSGAFPTAAGANPTLTIAALSLRSADAVF
jgi:choline dehydrogenase-like flavoprotein